MKARDIILIIGGASFIALVISLSLLLADRFQVRGCGCPKVVSHNFIWLFIILAIIFVAALFYYLFSLKIEKKEKVISQNIEVLSSILDNDENNVLDLLVKNKGKISQAKISKKYDKIKAHRIIKKLQEKNIIDIEKEGKTNTIILKKELKEVLVK
jgi:uncharacterized membrane protein